jgi:hypothetical protein
MCDGVADHHLTLAAATRQVGQAMLNIGRQGSPAGQTGLNSGDSHPTPNRVQRTTLRAAAELERLTLPHQSSESPTRPLLELPDNENLPELVIELDCHRII